MIIVNNRYCSAIAFLILWLSIFRKDYQINSIVKLFSFFFTLYYFKPPDHYLFVFKTENYLERKLFVSPPKYQQDINYFLIKSQLLHK